MKKNESGKVTLMKGSFRLFWEELKTMNMMKFKALTRIASGYFRMKYKDSKKSDFSLDNR